VRVVFSSNARADRREAQAYYASKSPAAADAFRRELRHALQFLTEFPAGAPVYFDDVRAKIMRNFPYTIFYRVIRDGSSSSPSQIKRAIRGNIRIANAFALTNTNSDRIFAKANVSGGFVWISKKRFATNTRRLRAR